MGCGGTKPANYSHQLDARCGGWLSASGPRFYGKRGRKLPHEEGAEGRAVRTAVWAMRRIVCAATSLGSALHRRKDLLTDTNVV